MNNEDYRKNIERLKEIEKNCKGSGIQPGQDR